MKIFHKFLLIISLVFHALTIFFAVAPLGLMWVYSMILPLVNMVLYGIIFFTFLKQKHSIISLLFLLFIPLFAYSAVNISTSGDDVSYILSAITIIYVSGLTILLLIMDNKLKKFEYKNSKIIFIILLVICGVSAIVAYKITSIYYDLIHNMEMSNLENKFNEIIPFIPIIIYIGLMIVYIIFATITLTKNKKKEEF